MSAVICLSQKESTRLAELENTIARGQKTFVEVGNALAEIRDTHLYRETGDTFESYCRDRWGWARSTAYQFIDAAKVVKNVRNCGQTTPTSEGQIRPLTKLKTGEDQYKAWTRAHEIAEESNEPVTGKIVERAVAEITNVTPIKVYEPEPIVQTSKAFRFAQEAIVCLGKIRPQDPNRDQALQSVIDWIKVNK